MKSTRTYLGFAPVAATVGFAIGGAAIAARLVRRRRRIHVQGRVALITGGSRGLGLLLARELGRLGAHVVIAARDADELDRARADLRSRGVSASTVVADVSVPSEAARIVDDVATAFGRLDILINNAGIMTVGPLDHMTTADFEEAMAVHFHGPLHAMRAAIPHMRRLGGGRIVNISSIGGKIGVPHLVPYCASKFALAGLSSASRAELLRDRIYVTTVCPGLMRTGSPFNAWFKGRYREEFAWFAVGASLPVLTMSGSRAAARIVDAARHGDAELVMSWPAVLAVVAAAVFPRPVAAMLDLTNRLLPSPDEARGDGRHRGWRSGSRWAPSLLTRPSARSAAENNEVPLREHVPI